MKEQLFDDLLTSVKEAGQILRGKLPPSRVFTVKALDVRRLRQSLKLSQAQFAALVHVSVKTLRNWEQGARAPGGAAAALLTAIRNDPKNVISALNVNQAQPIGLATLAILESTLMCVPAETRGCAGSRPARLKR